MSHAIDEAIAARARLLAIVEIKLLVMSAIATIDAATALQPWLLAIETLVLGLVERPGLFISDWQMYCEAFSLAEELHAMLCMSFARVAKESIVGDSVDAVPVVTGGPVFRVCTRQLPNPRSQLGQRLQVFIER